MQDIVLSFVDFSFFSTPLLCLCFFFFFSLLSLTGQDGDDYHEFSF